MSQALMAVDQHQNDSAVLLDDGYSYLDFLFSQLVSSLPHFEGEYHAVRPSRRKLDKTSISKNNAQRKNVNTWEKWALKGKCPYPGE